MRAAASNARARARVRASINSTHPRASRATPDNAQNHSSAPASRSPELLSNEAVAAPGQDRAYVVVLGREAASLHDLLAAKQHPTARSARSTHQGCRV